MASSILAPESSDITRDIYEVKDDPRAKYVGDSQALAYLLALISRSRDIRPDMAGHDLWCTGSIDIADGKRPILDAVDFEGFNIKLNAFLFEQEKDTLFVVPAPIIQPMHEALFKEHDVRVISLTQASELSADENFRGKTVLLVPPFSLDVLLEALFEMPVEKELPLGPNPYKGLEAFQEADAARFFGREQLTQDIWEKFQGLHQTPSDGSARLRFLAILGPSGSGKSSVARAGLIPLLRDKRIARRAFLRLVRLGEGTRDTRRRVSLCELVAHKEDPDHVRKIVHEFSKPGTRLITLSSDEQENEIAEVTHEALFGHWKTLKGWLDQGRDDLRFHHRLVAAAGHWEKQKRQAGLLWRSPDLDVLRRFYRKKSEDMTELQVGFFEASERTGD